MNSEASSLKDILSQYLHERGLENVVKEASIPELWNEIVGSNAVKHTKVVRYEHKQLTIEVDSSVWRTELRLRSDELMKRMNERLGIELVREIILR